MNTHNFPKLLFWFSCLSLIFAWGVGVGHYQVFPYSALVFGKESVLQVWQARETLSGIRPTEFISHARYPGAGVTRLKSDQIAPGLTLLSGFFDGNNEVRLIRPDGSIVNRWPVRFSEIFPNRDHIKPPSEIPKTDWNVELNSSLALSDGSVLLNFSNAGTVKLDRCGIVQWTVPRMTHHSLEQAQDGGFWVPGRRYVEDASEYPPVKVPYSEDTILKISAQGEVLAEIPLTKLLLKNDELKALFFANGRMNLDIPRDGSGEEINHLNDVEELSPVVADRFPEFTAGDLLVSERNLNLIMVIDPKTQEVKWHQTGPWIRQHDPDFETNGEIGMFNNNTDDTSVGSIWGGSRIMEIDPNDRKTSVLYGTGAHQRFYSRYAGKHQRLSNGNLLVTEFGAGRVFEARPQGDVVWEYINRYDEDEVAVLTQAIRYPENYFNVKDWACR